MRIRTSSFKPVAISFVNIVDSQFAKATRLVSLLSAASGLLSECGSSGFAQDLDYGNRSRSINCSNASRLGSSGSEFPAVGAGAGTWVCGIRKTTQMVPALGSRCKWKGRRIELIGSSVEVKAQLRDLSFLFRREIWVRSQPESSELVAIPYFSR